MRLGSRQLNTKHRAHWARRTGGLCGRSCRRTHRTKPAGRGGGGQGQSWQLCEIVSVASGRGPIQTGSSQPQGGFWLSHLTRSGAPASGTVGSRLSQYQEASATSSHLSALPPPCQLHCEVPPGTPGGCGSTVSLLALTEGKDRWLSPFVSNPAAREES